MIVEFSIENYKSFKELQTIQLRAAGIKSKYPSIDEQNVVNTNKVKLLKSKAIFGANGSGKSNVVLAFKSFITIIQENVKDEQILQKNIYPFRLCSETVQQPSFFQIVFQLKNHLYRYGFEADNEKICSEWLFVKNKKEVPYFIREYQEVLAYNKNSFSEIEIVLKNKKHNELYRQNSLLISVLKSFNTPLSTSLWKVLTQQIISYDGLNESPLIEETLKALKNKIFKEKLLLFLKGFDDTIADIKQTPIPMHNLPETIRQQLIKEGKSLKFISVMRKRQDGRLIEFALDEEEAQGTKKLFYLAHSVFMALQYGTVLIIDELNANLHPSLNRQFISIFNNNITNPKGAQLIFTTHDSTLLDAKLLRRDQIVFVEKSIIGESKLIELVSFKSISHNTTYERDYLAGKYGAVPKVTQLSKPFAY